MDRRSRHGDLHQLIPRWAFGVGALILGSLGGVLIRSSETGELAVPLIGLAIISGWEFAWGGGAEGQSRYRPLLGSAIGATIAAGGMFVIAGLASAPNVAGEARWMGAILVLLTAGLIALMLWTRHQQRQQGNENVGLFATVTPQQKARRDRVTLVVLTWVMSAGGVVMVFVALASPAPIVAMLPALPLLAVAAFCGYKLYRNREHGPGPW
jgi:hypothetical protein